MIRYLAILFLSCIALNAQPVFSLKDEAFISKTSSLLRGLVGYWRLEEGSGTRYDCSVNGNHLTANNSPTNSTAISGFGIKQVAASSQYLSKSSPVGMPFGSKTMTVAGWKKFITLPGDNYVNVICGVYDFGNNQRSFVSGFYLQKVRFAVSADGTNVVAVDTTVTAYATNTWYFVCGWIDGTNANVQLNNGTVYSAAFTNSLYSSTAPLGVGIRYNNGVAETAALSDAIMDEVGIWNRALSASERTQLYKSGIGTTYPRFSINDATDFDFDTWQPLYDRPKPFPTLVALVARREPEPLITLCE